MGFNIKVPDLRGQIASKMPKLQDKVGEAKALVNDRISANMPNLQDVAKNADINQLGKLPSEGELISKAAAKVGLDVDSVKIDDTIGKIEAFKSDLNQKALDKVTELAEKAGYMVDIPTSEDLTSEFMTELAGKDDFGLQDVQKYISSKVTKKK